MQTVSMQDLGQFSYWQDKRLTSSHCYDLYNPVISVELTELADRVVANNDSVVEIKLDLCIRQLCVPATVKRQNARQDHMRRVHGRICREREVNLYLHLQHLSEEKNFKNEWQFAESRPIEHGEHNDYLCGQTHIESYFL